MQASTHTHQAHHVQTIAAPVPTVSVVGYHFELLCRLFVLPVEVQVIYIIVQNDNPPQRLFVQEPLQSAHDGPDV